MKFLSFPNNSRATGFTLPPMLVNLLLLATLMAWQPAPGLAQLFGCSVNITSTDLLTVSPGQAINQTLHAAGGIAPYTWSVAPYTPLPSGFSLSPGGVLTGMPGPSGGSFEIRVTDSTGCSAFRNYQVYQESCAGGAIGPDNLNDGTLGALYQGAFFVTAPGTFPPYTFTYNGNLPVSAGSNGLFFGTPYSTGRFIFHVGAMAASQLPGACIASKSYEVVIGPELSFAGASNLPSGVRNQPYSGLIASAAGSGTPPYTYEIDYAGLPAGLTLNGGTGMLTGTPTTYGVYYTKVRIRDSAGGAITRRARLLIAHESCPTITISPTSLPNATIGVPYSQTITATGGAPPKTIGRYSGSLPGGLTIASNGLLSGTPTATGTFTFEIFASDANNCLSLQEFTLIVATPPSGMQFYPLAAPVRLLDTRPGASPSACSQPNAPLTGGASRTQPGRNICTIPATAQALTGNITTVASGGGYLTLYPSDATLPTVASTNFNPNQIINNVFTVGLATTGANAGSFNIFALTNTDVVVDITGYYAPPGAASTVGLYFHPLPAPIRLLETRPGELGYTTPGAMLPGNADTAQIGRGLTYNGVTIPATAQALVGNATTVNPGGGYLTLYPQGAARPTVASSNYNLGDIMNAPFTVGLGGTGQFMMYVTSSTHLIVDVLGYYSADATDLNGTGLLFTPLPAPVRLLETRAGQPVGCYLPNAPLLAGSTRTQVARNTCGIPATAQGIVGNATTVSPLGGGYLTFFPSSATQPLVASSNFSPGQIINRHFIVGLGNADGAFKIYTTTQLELVVDVSGYFAP